MSVETAKESFADIGKKGGLEATEAAGKHWLSQLDKPWLLIIDNVDNTEMKLKDLFPEGGKGNVLITTRNPDFAPHGNTGSAELEGLKQTEALSLLLHRAHV